MAVKLERLEKILKERNIDYSGFAVIVGVNNRTMSMYIQGGRCSFERAKKIAKILKVSIEHLTGLENEVTKRKKVYDTPCQNQGCPLNEKCICINDTVLEGRAPCDGKHKITPPRRKGKKFEVFY